MKPATITVRRLSGKAILPYIEEAARLRIEVFREYPYLYEGDMKYEQAYLKSYTGADSSVMVLAMVGKKIIGVSTGMSLEQAAEEFRNPFIQQGYDLRRIFYFGESVLQREYRGRGIGHAFFDERECHARHLGFQHCVFCAIDRSKEDPRRPSEFRPLNAFWHKRGYQPIQGLKCQLSWKEIGAATEQVHSLQFWAKPALEALAHISR